MADDEEAGAEDEGGGDDAYDPQRALVAQSLEVNKLRQHVEVLKRANERIRDQYKQEIRSLLHPLIERHRKLQVENGKLQEKIEKLSVAPPGSDEALVEELRKLRHDHGILQKITEGLEADSRLARRLQAELEEATQRIEALDVRVADLERERRRLEMLVSERDQARVELDEQLEKAQAELREWKEKHEKATQAHKDELRGYQQQLGEAIGRYKALEKQHQDALFARDLLPILYEELQAEAATYDELTALFAGARGNPDAYRPADLDQAGSFQDSGDDGATPVTAEAPFSSYQPSPEATIALATGLIATAGMAAIDPDAAFDEPVPADLDLEALATEPAHVDPAMGDLDVIAEGLGDADLGLQAPVVPEVAAADDLERMDLGDLGFSDDELAVLQDLPGSPETTDLEALDPAAAAPAFDVGGLAFGDVPDVAQVSDPFGIGNDTFATEAMHAGYDLAVEAEILAGDDLIAFEDDVLEPIDNTVADPGELAFEATGFSFAQAETLTEAGAEDADLTFDASGFSFGQSDQLADVAEDLTGVSVAGPEELVVGDMDFGVGDIEAEAGAQAFDAVGFSFGPAEAVAETEPVLSREDDFGFDSQELEAGLDQLLGDATLQLGSDDYASDLEVGPVAVADDSILHANDDADELGSLLGADALVMADEPLVLGTTGFDEDLAEQAALAHGSDPHPITDQPHLAIDDAAAIDEQLERTLIDREVWEIDDAGAAVTLGETALIQDEIGSESAELDALPDFASQLAQSLGGFADTTDDDVEDLVWEDGPLDEAAEQAATGGVMFAPGAIEQTTEPAAAPTWDLPDDETLTLPPLDVEDETDDEDVSDGDVLNLDAGWPVGGAEAEEAATEMLSQEATWGAALPQDHSTTGAEGSWAAAMATESVGLRHSETSISPEDIARLLDDDDDLGSVPFAGSADADGPDFRIQPPKLEPPPLP